jgi:glucosyl-3-phosphoglycerate synthase
VIDRGPGVRIFHTEDFAAAALARRPGRPTVSVVIPARNEQDTVGDIVARIHEDLVRGHGLVDELVVIDSDSVDDTAAAARAAGAVVHRAKDIRPDLGPALGKGEALWKSLLVTRGDVLVFVDADLTEWDTHFVPGLLGPMLADPATALVKSFYTRPLRVPTDGGESESGGRVTELVARPLLALHWPELADVVQPLSGEWAIRRDVVERLWLPVGYGVEIAVLIDTARAHGVQAVAQVDLGRRGHRHHHHHTLGAMALQVMAAAERRLGRRDGAERAVEMRQYEKVGADFTRLVSEVAVWERPPAASIAAPARTSP